MAYRIGIDAGSKTIKFVILDDDGSVAFSIYSRHRFDIATLLAKTVHDACWRFGDIEGTIAITGSAGIELAQWLGLPFVQEVIATTEAVQTLIPDADAVIELGGEDAKVIYLGENLEQRMNATCAGGTGGFIDTIAFMLGIRTKDFSQLSMGASHIYPIASRCAVFAQTDVRPLLNAGASKADIAASVLEAVVRQTLGGLACGRPIRGKVVFLGGPCEYIPDLVRRFQNALGLDRYMGVKPTDAHLFTAQGAAIYGGKQADAATIRLSELEARLKQESQPQDDLPRLKPLFESEEELSAFRERHAQTAVSTSHVTKYEGPLYVGMDAGSTAVKLACVSDTGKLIYSANEPTDGDVLETARWMLLEMYKNLPHGYNGVKFYTIEHATVTGYGEELLRSALGFDSGVVETIAHTTSALHFEPKATFLLDIGGQDMKAIWLEDGVVQDAMLNEACSSGCGSFIEGTAYTLRCTPPKFAERALRATSPIDLGTKCTVFMTSRVRHAQKIGAAIEDIAAGIAYSVVQNALFRIIGMNNVESMGDHIVVQGGTFMSDAVLRAFEIISGKEVLRPGCAHLMGALGAALVARRRHLGVEGIRERMEQANQKTDDAVFRDIVGRKGASSLLSAEEIKAIKPKRISATCPGCENSCAVTVLDFGNGRHHVSGNRCERAYEFFNLEPIEHGAHDVPPNAIALKQKLLARYKNATADERISDCDSSAKAPDTPGKPQAPGISSAAIREQGPSLRIGIMNTLNATDQLPFWHTLLTELGFDVATVHTTPEDAAMRNRAGLETIPSESACFPAKLSHSRLFELIDAGATHILMPKHVRGRRCAVRCGYADALQDGISAFDFVQPTFITPVLQTTKALSIENVPEDQEAIFQSLAELFKQGSFAGLQTFTRDTFQKALEAAWEEQRRFNALVQLGNEKALQWARKPEHHGIVMACRPYHVDPMLMHRIDDMLQDLGFAVISAEELDLPGLPSTEPKPDFHASKEFLKIARFIEGEPNLHMVCLESFGCTYDAISLPEVQQVLKEADQTYTVLKIDEICDMAHIRIRLRTLAETIVLSELDDPFDIAFDHTEEMFEKPRTEFSKHEFIKKPEDGGMEARTQDNTASEQDAEKATSVPSASYLPPEASAAVNNAAVRLGFLNLEDKAPEVDLPPAGTKAPPLPRSFIEKLKSGMLR